MTEGIMGKFLVGVFMNFVGSIVLTLVLTAALLCMNFT